LGSKAEVTSFSRKYIYIYIYIYVYCVFETNDVQAVSNDFTRINLLQTFTPVGESYADISYLSYLFFIYYYYSLKNTGYSLMLA